MIMLELNNIFSQINTLLKELNQVLQSEQVMLVENSLAHSLSDVIDKKNLILVNLKLLDQKRLELNKKYNISPPYIEHDGITIQWNDITSTIKSLSQINKDNGNLLQTRIDKTQQAITFFNQHSRTNYYTSVGYTQTDEISTKRAEV